MVKKNIKIHIFFDSIYLYTMCYTILERSLSIENEKLQTQIFGTKFKKSDHKNQSYICHRSFLQKIKNVPIHAFFSKI
jgi:hypothetical protein